MVCLSIGIQQFFVYYDIENVTYITYNLTGQAIMGKSNKNLKEVLIEQKEDKEHHRHRLNGALLTLNF